MLIASIMPKLEKEMKIKGKDFPPFWWNNTFDRLYDAYLPGLRILNAIS